MATDGGLSQADLQAMIVDSVGKAVGEAIAEVRAKAGEKVVSSKPAAPTRFYKNENSIGRLVRYLAQARNDSAKAQELATEAGDVFVADAIRGPAKAMAEGTLAGGGALVMGEFATSVIETLRAQAVVRSAGATQIPMSSGSLTMPYGDTASTASYTGEVTAQNESSPTTGQLQLSAKKLRVTTAVSNDLLRDTSGMADSFITSEVAGAIATREDQAFLIDDGTSGTPKGMVQWITEASNNFATAGTTLAQVNTDLTRALRTPMDDNVRSANPHWFFHSRVWGYLMGLATSDGAPAFRNEMREGTLLGIPFSITTQLPITLGGGTESYILYVNMGHAIIADTTDLEVAVFDQAAYNNSSGTVVSAVSRDETVVRALARHDFGMRFRGNEGALVTGVTYGA